MKKLKLEARAFENAQTLTRSQLRNVFGGVASTCTNKCADEDDCPGDQVCANITYPDGKTCTGCIDEE